MPEMVNPIVGPPDLGQIAGSAMSLKELGLKMQQQQAAVQSQNALRSVFQDPASLDANGQPTGRAMSRIMAIDPGFGLNLQKASTDLDIAKTEAFGKKLDLSHQTGNAALMTYQAAIDSGIPEPQARANAQATFDSGLAQMKSSGLFSQDEINSFNTQFDPIRAKANAETYEQYQAHLDRQAAINRGDRAETEKERHDRAVEDGGALSLDETGIDYAADVYRDTGQLPNTGIGKQGAKLKAKIIQSAAQKAKTQGTDATGDVATQAGVKADRASLANLTKMTDSALSFEATAEKNMQVVENLMNKGAGTAAGPVVNRWLQAGRKGSGDPDVAAFDLAMNTVSNEYAKIISGSTGSMAATEGARQDAQAMMPTDYSIDQINKSFSIMRQDMKNRTSSLTEKRSDIQARIRGVNKPDAGGLPKIADSDDGRKAYGALTKGAHYLDPDGVERIKQ